MGLNQVIVDITLQELDKFKSDSSLYDAIVQRDIKLVLYLVNNKYKLDIINRGYIKEPVSINRVLQSLESGLSKNKQIRLIQY